VSTQGTSFASGIKMAIDAFERGGISTDPTTQVTRVILMVSDGEDHDDGDIQVAKQLQEKKIRLFTVAYGTEKGAPIPVRDQMGYIRGYKQDENQNAVISKVDGTALKKLAEAGEGTFSFAVVGGSHLKKISEDLSSFEKTKYNSATATQYEEKYQIFLVLALMFLLLDIFLSERKDVRSRSRFWKGRFL
jgi:Ca-activated chloride channel family protein